MTLEEIKQAVDQGKKVHWSNEGYEVIKDSKDQYLIRFLNGDVTGLTWRDGKTLNGEESDFFLAESNTKTIVFAHLEEKQALYIDDNLFEQDFYINPAKILREIEWPFHFVELVVHDSYNLEDFGYEFPDRLTHLLNINVGTLLIEKDGKYVKLKGKDLEQLKSL